MNAFLVIWGIIRLQEQYDECIGLNRCMTVLSSHSLRKRRKWESSGNFILRHFSEGKIYYAFRIRRLVEPIVLVRDSNTVEGFVSFLYSFAKTS